MLSFPREWLSERRFPGLLGWFSGIWGIALLFGAISWIAYARFDGRIFDVTRTALIPGLWLSILAIAAATILAKILTVSWKAASAFVLRLMPVLLLVPIIDAALSLITGSIPLSWPLASPNAVFEAILSFGFIVPNFLTWGETIGWVVAVVGMGWMIWQLTKSKKQTALGMGLLHLVIAALIAVPSLFAWTSVSSFSWTLGSVPMLFSRALVTFVHGSYWWRNSSERFFGVAGSEGEASVQGLMAISLFLAVSFWWLYWWKKEQAASLAKLLSWFRIQALAWLFVPFLIGLAWGWNNRLDLVWSLPTWLAFLGLLLVLKAMWAAMCLQNDIADLADDERLQRSTRLTTGALSIHQAEEEVTLWRAMALIGAWILGWPIFASVAVFFVARWFYEGQPFRLKAIWPLNQVVLGFTGLVWAWIGWFFLTQSAAIQPFGRPVMLGIWLVLVAIGSLRGRSPLTPSRIY